ncbi:indoleacetamide hydrolase [Ramlibacter sp. WS9]|uniref:indoleacetamide hydrolase n=1 Tax=Ramlibacter sp. WS9 TaxID=1882741 RepID=UPI001E63D688|nr:indoleacetamide hydrolase [Ramlibacter sp. WS9]
MISLPRRLAAPLALALALAACGGAAVRIEPDIYTLSASEAAGHICSGAMTSESVVKAYLARAKARPDLNAFVTLDEAGALKAARDADTRRATGAPCLPLEGVPIVVKDNIQVAGLPATAGTPALKNFVPAADAPVLKKLRDAGAVVLGKTNMHELAFGISGYNPAYNTSSNVGVRNAYDATKMSGGSSAGTAAALGSRMAPAGLGTDTGASVRLPCALNGCSSLRPTVGRYSQAGIAPISHTRDTAGPMAVAMADVELMDRVITGAAATQPADLKAVRVGIAADFMANMDADTQAAFNGAIAKLKAAGVTVVDVTMPNLATINGNVGFPVALYEAYDDMVSYLATYNTGVTIAQLAAGIASPDVKGTYDGLVIPRKLPTPTGLIDAAPVYNAAMTVHRPALIKLYADTFANNQLDALIFPTVPRVALTANADSSSLDNFLLFIQNTDPGSNAGIPGIQVPIGLGASSKLPIGLELDGPSGSDRRLVAIGMAIEAVLGRIAPAR